MEGNLTRGNPKRKGAPPPELGEAARTTRRTIYFEPGNLESTRHQRMPARGKLAVKENHIKGLVETPDPSEINFNEMVKDVEDVIRALQY